MGADVMPQDGRRSFMSHFLELRARLMLCLLGVGAAMVLCLIFGGQILDFLVRPCRQAAAVGATFRGEPAKSLNLVAIHPAEAFNTYLYVSLLAGLVLASPFIIYQAWRFLSPGLLDSEKRALKPILFLGFVLFIAGALLAHLYITKLAFLYLLLFSQWIGIEVLWTVTSVVNFSLALLIAFGAVFELPLVILALVKAGIITPAALRKGRRYFILIDCIVSAIVTPPDPMSMIAMAAPLLLLYEFSIVLAGLAYKEDKGAT